MYLKVARVVLFCYNHEFGLISYHDDKVFVSMEGFKISETA